MESKQNKGKGPKPQTNQSQNQPQQPQTSQQGANNQNQKGGKKNAANNNANQKGKAPAAPAVKYVIQNGEELVKPNVEERDKRIEVLKSKIGNLEKELSKADDQIKTGGKSENPEYQQKRTEHVTELKRLRAELKEKRTEKDAIQEDIDRIEAERSELKHQRDVLRKELPSDREDKIEERIRELEFKHKSESLSIQEEKKLIGKLRGLRNAKEEVKRLRELEEKIGSGLEQTNTLLKQVKVKQVEIGKIRNEIQTHSDALEELRSTTASSGTEKATLIKKRNLIKESIDKLYAEIRQEREDFKVATDSFYTKLREVEAKRIAEADKRKEEKRKQRDEHQKAIEKKNEEYLKKKKEFEEYKRLHPYDEHIAVCDSLIEYLQKLPKHNQPAPKKDAKPSTSKDAQPQQAPQKQKGVPLKHPIDKFTAFSFVKVAIPSTSDRVMEAIKDLNNRKQYFKNYKPQPKEKKEKKTEGASASATTSENASTTAVSGETTAQQSAQSEASDEPVATQPETETTA